jgi:hypothetical protein
MPKPVAYPAECDLSSNEIGVGSAAVLGLADVINPVKGPVAPTYLLDAVPQLLTVLAPSRS